MPGDGAVGGFGLDCLAVGRHQHRRHQAQRAVALCDGVRLHVAVVVLARPDVTAFPFQAGGDHVVDQPMLVGQPRRFELRLEFLFVDALELVFEHPVVGLEDGVLGGQIYRPFRVEAVGERRAREIPDGFLEVVHPQHDAAVLGDGHHFVHDRRAAVGGRESQCDGARLVDLEVRRPILVTKSVPADDDRLGPPRNQSRHIRNHDRFAKDCAAQDVPDCPIGRQPHLLQVEFLDTGLVGGDRRALYAHTVFLDRIRRVDRHLVVGGVAVLDAQVVIVQADVEIGKDKHVLDELPDDTGHLVTVELYDRTADFYLGCVGHGSPHQITSSPRGPLAAGKGPVETAGVVL